MYDSSMEQPVCVRGEIPKILNVGCGYTSYGDINLDYRELPNVDVVHDLNVFPYPFEDKSFDEILCFEVLEHLHSPYTTLKELRRIYRRKFD